MIIIVKGFVITQKKEIRRIERTGTGLDPGLSVTEGTSATTPTTDTDPYPNAPMLAITASRQPRVGLVFVRVYDVVDLFVGLNRRTKSSVPNNPPKQRTQEAAE
jgi:hypothetical protein